MSALEACLGWVKHHQRPAIGEFLPIFGSGTFGGGKCHGDACMRANVRHPHVNMGMPVPAVSVTVMMVMVIGIMPLMYN